MTRATAKPRTRNRLRRVEGDPAVLGPLLRECGVLACNDDPVSCHSMFDSQGRPRRVHAQYPDGWRATLVLRLNGTYSVSQSIKLTSAPKSP